MRRLQRYISSLEHKQDAASKDHLKSAKEKAANLSGELRNLLEISARRYINGHSAEAQTARVINRPAESDVEVEVPSPPTSYYGETNSQASSDRYPQDFTYISPRMRSDRIVPTQRKSRAKKKVVKQVQTVRTGHTSMPPQAPNIKHLKTSREQVEVLYSYFRTYLLPLCDLYVRYTPDDQKTRESQHTKLSETIMSQVLLHADCIEIDIESTRNARRRLVGEAQATLKRLDDALNGSRKVAYVEDIYDD